MAKNKVIKEQGFKQKSSVKHVKTRTPYRAVDEYEKQFKYAYAKMISQTMQDVAKMLSGQLKVGRPVLRKSMKEEIEKIESDVA